MESKVLKSLENLRTPMNTFHLRARVSEVPTWGELFRVELMLGW